MAQPARHQDIQRPAQESANDNRAPTPRLVIDNTINQQNDQEQPPSDAPARPQRPFNVKVDREPHEKKHTSQKAVGTAMQGTGMAMQGLGKGMNVAGSGMTRAGAALSSTGIGAIVGAPMMAVGGASKVAGKGIDKTGKIVRKSGKAVKRNRVPTRYYQKERQAIGALRLAQNLNLADATRLRRRVKVVRASWMAGSVSLMIFIPQAGFWLGGMTAVGFQQTVTDLSNWLPYMIGVIPTMALEFAVDKVFPGEEIFASGWIISSTLSVISLFIALIIYYANTINPLRGKGLTVFGVLLALSFMPLGIIPWVYFWILTVFMEHRR